MLGAEDFGLRPCIWAEELLLQGGGRKGRAGKRQNLGICCDGSGLGITPSLLPCSTPGLRVPLVLASRQDLGKRGEV